MLRIYSLKKLPRQGVLPVLLVQKTALLKSRATPINASSKDIADIIQCKKQHWLKNNATHIDSSHFYLCSGLIR